MSVAAPTESTVKHHRGWVWTLIVLAALITLVSSLTVYVKRQALDSKAWANASGRLLQDKEVRDALSVYMVNELYDNVDVQAELESLLPKQTKSLAGPAAALLRQVAPRVASDLLGRPRIQDQWENLNYQAHQRFMNIINGKNTGLVQTEQGGDVVFDLHPIIQQLADRLGVGAQVSPTAGRLVIFKSDQLKLVQDIVKAIKVLSIFLIALCLILYAVAVWLARGWRREALRATGWSLVIVGVVLLLVRNLAGNSVVDALVKTDSDKTAARHIWLIGSTLLADVAWTLIFYGVAVVIACWIAGTTRWAKGIRLWLAPAFAEHVTLVGGVVAFLYLLLLLWGPTPAFHQWWGVLFFAALVAWGVWALRRETLQEFPDAGATTAGPGLRGHWDKLRGGAKDGGSGPPPPSGSEPPPAA